MSHADVIKKACPVLQTDRSRRSLRRVTMGISLSEYYTLTIEPYHIITLFGR